MTSMLGPARHSTGSLLRMQDPRDTQTTARSYACARALQVLDLGRTQLPEDVREALLADLSERYTPGE